MHLTGSSTTPSETDRRPSSTHSGGTTESVSLVPIKPQTRPNSRATCVNFHTPAAAATAILNVNVNVDRERQDKLNRKRREIINKVKEREKQARELDLRKRAERLMNRNSGLESLDSSSDSEDEAESEIDETRAGFLPALNSPGGESSSPSFSTLPKQRLHRPSALALPNINNGDYRQVPSAGPAVGPDKSPPRRRLNSKTVMKSLLPNNNRIRSREQKPSEGFAFSFLSEDVWDKG